MGDWRNISGPKWYLRGLSSVLLEWLDSANVYKAVACSVFNSSALPKGIWLSTCSCWYCLVLWPVQFWKELPQSICKGLLLHFSLCEIFFLFLCMLWLSMDVLLMCMYLRNIKLFLRFFLLCNTFFLPLKKIQKKKGFKNTWSLGKRSWVVN